MTEPRNNLWAEVSSYLDEALELDPDLEAARERLKKLRWGILG